MVENLPIDKQIIAFAREIEYQTVYEKETKFVGIRFLYFTGGTVFLAQILTI
jgi:hypothetical protein